MSTKFVKQGDSMNVTLSGTVAVNDVDVIGTGIIGVALKAGVSGDVIPYAISGVYYIPKVTGAVIAQGEQVYWDVSAGNCDDNAATPATGDFLCGMADEAAGSGVLEIAVHINKRTTTVT